MKRRFGKYLLAVFAGCLLAMVPCRAQTKAQRVDILHGLYQDNMEISLVPLPIFFDGFRADFDCRLKDRLWLQLAPQYNCRRKGYFTRTDGFCFDANLRYYLFRTTGRGFYLASGIGIDYNRITENSEDFPVPPKSAFLYKIKRHQENIGFSGEYSLASFRFGGQFQIGYQLDLWPRAVMDFYIGAAYRYSFNSFKDNTSEAMMRRVAIKPWMYQYSGVYMQLGVRIGFML